MYQMNLVSNSAPIHIMLINRDSDGSAPVVFSLPPDNMCVPTPPATPATLQRFPLTSSHACTSFSYCSQEPLYSDQQMGLLDRDEVPTPSPSTQDLHLGEDRDEKTVDTPNHYVGFVSSRGKINVSCPRTKCLIVA